MEELGLPLSKIRVIPLPLGRPRERRGVVAEVVSEAATAAATSALRPPLVLPANPASSAAPPTLDELCSACL